MQKDHIHMSHDKFMWPMSEFGGLLKHQNKLDTGYTKENMTDPATSRAGHTHTLTHTVTRTHTHVNITEQSQSLKLEQLH